MCLLAEYTCPKAAVGELLFFSSAKRGEWKEVGMKSQWEKIAIWFGKHPLHFDPTVNDPWRCCICFSCHRGGFVHWGLKGTCEGSTSSQHKEHYTQPLLLNIQGTVQAHHRSSCGIVVPAFLRSWLVWWCLNHLSRACKALIPKKISQIKVLDFQFCCSSH